MASTFFKKISIILYYTLPVYIQKNIQTISFIIKTTQNPDISIKIG